MGNLFDASAHHYDRISALMSFGTDKSYRRQVLLHAGLKPGMRMLDVACGTGMVAEPASAIVGPSGEVVGLDPSSGMLSEAVKQGRVSLPTQGVAEQLPFADDTFDFLTMGFALRHVADLHTTFAEYRRVLKPGGTALILEITRPDSKVYYQIFKFHLKTLVPIFTRLTTLNKQAQSLMDYHWDTVEFCVPATTILNALEGTGFAKVDRRVQLGIFNEYKATK
ncbi:MAG: class I SAM-dependent methyltransferase [Pseudomonadota bacterium]